MNEQHIQTGRTTRMVELAKAAAAQRPETIHFIVVHNHDQARWISEHHMKRSPPNLRAIAASSSAVKAINIRAGKIIMEWEGTYPAFYDHTVIEEEIRALQVAYEACLAKPGEYGHPDSRFTGR